MKLIDISMTISEQMVVYKNRTEKKPRIITTKNFEDGGVYESRIELDLHTGTHVDAPLHMMQGGMTLDQLSLDTWHGWARVLDFSHIEDAIHDYDLEDLEIHPGEILIFKTRNSYERQFNANFIYLSSDAAGLLAKRGIRGVGIDALGIERAQPDHGTHRQLFEAGCFILEGLSLAKVEAGRYYLFALPLKIEGTEASPVRAVLMAEDGFK